MGADEDVDVISCHLSVDNFSWSASGSNKPVYHVSCQAIILVHPQEETLVAQWTVQRVFEEFKDLEVQLRRMEPGKMRAVPMLGKKEKKPSAVMKLKIATGGWFGSDRKKKEEANSDAANSADIEENRIDLDAFMRSLAQTPELCEFHTSRGSFELKRFIDFSHQIHVAIETGSSTSRSTATATLVAEQSIPDKKKAAYEAGTAPVAVTVSPAGAAHDGATAPNPAANNSKEDEQQLLYDAIMEHVRTACHSDETVIKEFKRAARKYAKDHLSAEDYYDFLCQRFYPGFAEWLVPNLVHLIPVDEQKTALLSVLEKRQNEPAEVTDGEDTGERDVGVSEQAGRNQSQTNNQRQVAEEVPPPDARSFLMFLFGGQLDGAFVSTDHLPELLVDMIFCHCEEDINRVEELRADLIALQEGTLSSSTFVRRLLSATKTRGITTSSSSTEEAMALVLQLASAIAEAEVKELIFSSCEEIMEGSKTATQRHKRQEHMTNLLRDEQRRLQLAQDLASGIVEGNEEDEDEEAEEIQSSQIRGSAVPSSTPAAAANLRRRLSRSGSASSSNSSFPTVATNNVHDYGMSKVSGERRRKANRSRFGSQRSISSAHSAQTEPENTQSVQRFNKSVTIAAGSTIPSSSGRHKYASETAIPSVASTQNASFVPTVNGQAQQNVAGGKRGINRSASARSVPSAYAKPQANNNEEHEICDYAELAAEQRQQISSSSSSASPTTASPVSKPRKTRNHQRSAYGSSKAAGSSNGIGHVAETTNASEYYAQPETPVADDAESEQKKKILARLQNVGGINIFQGGRPPSMGYVDHVARVS